MSAQKKAIAVPLDSASFPKMAGPDAEPDLALGDNPLWDLLISMESGKHPCTDFLQKSLSNFKDPHSKHFQVTGETSWRPEL